MDMVSIKRFDLFWVELRPTIGSEISKIRPCVIISPDVSNKHLNTIIIAPLTSTIRKYPTRIICKIKNKTGEIALDQIRTVDKSRLTKKIGEIDTKTAKAICDLLITFFEY